jgi:acetoin:2,6-dichlorophenolindophenol oxidoreductase subunit beta
MAAEGVTADIIDLRTLKPLDEAIILESVKKTGHLMVVDTSWAMAGVCAEIGCLVAEKGFHDLKAPVVRVGLPDTPCPAGFFLEQHFYPDVAKMKSAISKCISN